MENGKFIRNKPKGPSTDAVLKAHTDLFIHQSNLQWGRFQPLYWVQASFLAGVYLTRFEAPLLRMSLIIFALGILSYLFSLSFLDGKIKIQHLNSMARVGFVIESPKRPTWWPSLLPPWDILTLSVFYICLLGLDVSAAVISPTLGLPAPTPKQLCSPVTVQISQVPPTPPHRASGSSRPKP